MQTCSTKQLCYGAVICFIGALFYCYEFILRILPGVLQDELMQAFGHISASTFGQISALYYFAYSPMQVPVGLLIDRVGPRRLLTLACLLCAIGSLGFSYLSSMWIAGAGRFLVGLGSSFAFVGVLSLATHWLPRKYFSLVAGLMTTLGMCGLIYGEVEITRVAEQFGLPVVLNGTVMVGFILSALLLIMVRDAPVSDQMESPAVFAWSVFFKQVLKVIVSPKVWLVGLVGACLYTSLSVFGELWGKTYLEQAYHLSDLQAAKCMSAVFLGWAVGAPLLGFLSDHFARRIIPLMIGALGGLISIIAILYYPHWSLLQLFVWLFLYGVFTSAEIIVFVMGKEVVDDLNITGTVFAVVNMIVTLGGVIFQPLVGHILDWCALVPHVYGPLEYQKALSLLPGSLFLVLLLGFFLSEKKK
ncbi:MAG: MFS transporter [Legionellaceae bacterium]|nr:MFS transporter [Legionellaceae bacterium]